ncbi:DUF5809 family protein [Haloarchaeobius iranensis]|uniref:Uncharacterized protein n=1 Tax=Haloarchaeobius iranensis TaxID=996166 RepID=A0A1G9XTA7_9EURY|nr:DUF5809 family protein [Haloarchaeobius iranensis]SDM99493.1 hypothetical protein SAMN05192554_111107 [Haloarchaeobius iranensis]
MHTVGELRPETEESAREVYEGVGPTAQLVVKEVAKSMQFDREEYQARVDSDVVETARDVLFAAELAVNVGTREEYDEWAAAFDGEIHETGSEQVGHVAWHVAPFADEAVAATFADEEDAAVDTLRRQALGRIYRERL